MVQKNKINVVGSKILVVILFVSGVFLSQSCNAKLWGNIKKVFYKKKELSKRTKVLNEKLKNYKCFSSCKGSELVMPEASVIRKALNKRGFDKYFLEKTKMDEKHLGKTYYPEGIPLFVELAICDYIKSLGDNNPQVVFFSNIMRMRKWELIDIFKNRLWERDFVEEEVMAYLDYVIENPKLVIKQKPQVYYSEDYMSFSRTQQDISNFKNKLKKCMANHSKKVCESALNPIAKKVFNNFNKEYLKSC